MARPKNRLSIRSFGEGIVAELDKLHPLTNATKEAVAALRDAIKAVLADDTEDGGSDETGTDGPTGEDS